MLARVLTFIGALAITTSPIAASPPNLVLILADDCTYLDMEIYGGQAKTPHLNQLAKEGMTFSRCFQTAPMCSPTRHNLYTGIYPVKSGAWPNHTQVYPGTKSIAHYLTEVGYRVALSGKTHIGPVESFPFEYSGEFRTAEPDTESPYPKIHKLLAESKANQTPFCLIACSNEPHTPYNRGNPAAYPPETLELAPNFVDTPETRRLFSQYLAEITFFDQQCGKLLQMLEEHELASNTMVMVLSEQGSAFPFAKWTCYELGLTSGMIVRWPGQVTPGSKSNALVEYSDVTPTFLAIAGLGTPDTMDGSSFLPVLLGQATDHKTYTFGLHTTRGIINGSETFGIRSCGTKQYRYIRNLNSDVQFTNAVTRKGGDRADFWSSWVAQAEAGSQRAQNLVHRYQYRPHEELYDVVNDPYCLDNLIEQAPLSGIKQELSQQLDRWMQDQGDHGVDTEAIAHTRASRYIKSNGNHKPNY